MRPYPTMLPQSANSAGREAALPAALRGLSHRTARPEGSQCEAEKVAVRGGKGRSARRASSQCEAEEVAVRGRRGRSARPGGRSAKPRGSHCVGNKVALRNRRGRTAKLRARTASELCDPRASHCGGALRVRGLVLLRGLVLGHFLRSCLLLTGTSSAKPRK